MANISNKQMMNRSYVVYFAIALVGVSIIAKVLYIQFVEGSYWREKAENLTTVYRNIDAVRGNIYSDDESMLATSVPIYEVRMDLNADGLTDKAFNENIDSLSIKLSNLFADQSPVDWKRQLVAARQKGERYHLIRRRVKFHQMKVLRDFPIFNRGSSREDLVFFSKIDESVLLGCWPLEPLVTIERELLQLGWKELIVVNWPELVGSD